MKAQTGPFCWLLFLSLALGARSANFGVSPNVVSNDYTGLITFHMTGLPPGETVRLVQYLDFNGNGEVDADDLAVRGETVTDGQAGLVNGATNINVFRDEDGAADGAITASYHFTFAPVGGNLVGSHVFRCSSPASHFATTDLPFTVASAPYAQTVEGTVSDSSGLIPHAIVGLVQNVVLAAGPPKFIVGATADANGHYTLRAPAGRYLAVALKPGHVGNLFTFPTVVLGADATVAADFTLTAATTSITGSLRDSLNPAVAAVPYAEMAFTTPAGLVTIAVCDGNADFSVPVTAGVWTPGILPQSANPQSYLVPDASTSPHYDTRNGPVTGVVARLRHATALIQGRVQDNLGHPVPGASLLANADFGNYNSFADADSDGFFSLAIDAGEGIVSVQNPTDPPFNNYIWPTPQFNISNGQVLNLNVTGLVATARFRSHVVDDTGAPLSNLRAAADSYEVFGAYTYATTDDNGFLDLPVFGGKWGLLWLNQPPGLVFPDLPPFSITTGVNLTNDIVVRTVTGHISGYLHDAGGFGITNLTVTVTNHVGSTNFTLKTVTAIAGTYSVPVFDGIWNVGIDSNALAGKGYVPVAATNVTVPPANAVANFVAASPPPPQILTTHLPGATIGAYYSAPLTVTNGSPPMFWSLVSGVLPDGMDLNVFGFIFGTPTHLGLFDFSVKVRDPRGSNDIRALSILVRPVPTGPPQMLTTALGDLAVGCAFVKNLRATNGTPPYSWTLAAGSDPMPPGLNLATDGSVQGTPSFPGSFQVKLQLSGSDGASTNGTVQIQVNPALQLSAPPLTAGSVGAYYFGGRYTLGGLQPQTWSVISGALPPDLTLDPATGSITGIPAAVGVSSFTLRVTDGCATLETANSLTNYPGLEFLTPSLPLASVNVPYHAQLLGGGGLPPYAWYAARSLPSGLTLNLDGSITGTPSYETTTDITLQISDALGNGVIRVLTLVITSKPVLDFPTVPAADRFTFRVTGVSGQGYVLQSTADLTNWTDLLTTNAPADVFFLTDPHASADRLYYRLLVSP